MEVVRFSQIGKQDLKIGTGTFEVRLGDGRVVTLDEIRLTDFLSALTVGSVLFVKAGGVVGEDNSNLFYDDTNNRLGIATASPGAPLHVVGAIIGTTTLGPSASQQHTIPAVASDTYVLLAATQTLTNKTLTSPVLTAAVPSAAPATPTANALYRDSIVRGWVLFNGTGIPAIIADFNVGSITDNGGNGDYTINWATALNDANYVAICTASDTSGLNQPMSAVVDYVDAAPTTAGVRIQVFNSGNTQADADRISVIALGN